MLEGGERPRPVVIEFPVIAVMEAKDIARAARGRLITGLDPAKHGWVLRDTPVYDAAAAERHWQTLLALFEATL